MKSGRTVRGSAWKTACVTYKQLLNGWTEVLLDGPALHFVPDRYAFGSIQVKRNNAADPPQTTKGMGTVDPTEQAIVLSPGDTLYGLDGVDSVWVKADATAFVFLKGSSKTPQNFQSLMGATNDTPADSVNGYTDGALSNGLVQAKPTMGDGITLATGTLFLSKAPKTERRAILPAFAFVTASGENRLTAHVKRTAAGAWLDASDSSPANNSAQVYVVSPLAIMGVGARDFRRWRLVGNSQTGGADSLTVDQRIMTQDLFRTAAFNGGGIPAQLQFKSYPLQGGNHASIITAWDIDVGPVGGMELNFVGNNVGVLSDSTLMNASVTVDVVEHWVLDHEAPAASMQCLNWLSGSGVAKAVSGIQYASFWFPGDNMVTEFTGHVTSVAAGCLVHQMREPSGTLSSDLVAARALPQSPGVFGSVNLTFAALANAFFVIREVSLNRGAFILNGTGGAVAGFTFVLRATASQSPPC